MQGVGGEGDGIGERELGAVHGGRAKVRLGGGRAESPGTRLRGQEKAAGAESRVFDPGSARNCEKKG